jgi:hypothetical protein
MSIQNIIDEMVAELGRQKDLRDIMLRDAECPKALEIARRNRDAIANLPGLSHLVDRRTYKAKAAECILDLRRNRVALTMMGKNAYAADHVFLDKARIYRRMAAGQDPLPTIHTSTWSGER